MSKVIVSPLYDSDVFRMACRQFDLAADAINLPEAIRDRTKWPKRCLAVSLPIRRDDGSVSVFEGYRVQHSLSTGPSKGGIRFHPGVTIGEVAALAMWMSWKCSLVGLPYEIPASAPLRNHFCVIEEWKKNAVENQPDLPCDGLCGL
jgi:glutamate dehydrogenase (NAD(P)+)